VRSWQIVSNSLSLYDDKVSTPSQTMIDVIDSDQQDVHADLHRVVERHLQHPWIKPVPAHTADAFEKAVMWWRRRGNPPLIIDSFCGTGMSTALLAQRNPDACVIGLDKSSHRLSKHKTEGPNYLLVRAECESFWQCVVKDNIAIEQHWLLYPNPWPKASQLKRRIHGHPSFPLLKALGGQLELRTNWQIYAEEFYQACNQVGINGQLEPFVPENSMTLFETKYHDRGHQLWRFSGC
jgi:tRNA (guanine-N7-)-methyltransferase